MPLYGPRSSKKRVTWSCVMTVHRMVAASSVSRPSACHVASATRSRHNRSYQSCNRSLVLLPGLLPEPTGSQERTMRRSSRGKNRASGTYATACREPSSQQSCTLLGTRRTAFNAPPAAETGTKIGGGVVPATVPRPASGPVGGKLYGPGQRQSEPAVRVASAPSAPSSSYETRDAAWRRLAASRPTVKQ